MDNISDSVKTTFKDMFVKKTIRGAELTPSPCVNQHGRPCTEISDDNGCMALRGCKYEG